MSEPGFTHFAYFAERPDAERRADELGVAGFLCALDAAGTHDDYGNDATLIDTDADAIAQWLATMP